MPFLYVTEQGAKVCKTGERLIVEKEDEELSEIECQNLEAVLLFGNIQVTTQALAEMLEHGIEFAFLSESGRLKGRLVPPKAKNVFLRVAQHRLYSDELFHFKQAKIVVSSKVQNARNVLEAYQHNHEEIELDSYIRELDLTYNKILMTDKLDSLLGLEGAAARIYFSAFPLMLLKDWEFHGRRSHPATDPVNALLSFGYVLVGNELTSLLDAMGFDPYVGFYHALDYGRPSLALDLLEEFRHPLVDRFVLRLLNLGILNQSHFETSSDNSVYLTRDGKRKFFPEYESWLTEPNVKTSEGTFSFRKLFRRQAERMAKLLTEGKKYEPYIYRR